MAYGTIDAPSVPHTTQVRFQPFMSMSEREEVLREHERMAQVPGSVHARLEASLMQVRRRARRSAHKRLVWDKDGINAAAAREAVANYFWSYNTVRHVVGCVPRLLGLR